jgi:hypothetical protein
VRFPNPAKFERFADDGSDRHARIESAVRVLKHDLHLSTKRTQFGFAQSEHVFAVEMNGSSCRFEQTQNESARRRFAASRFADESQNFAGRNGKRNAIDGFDDSRAAGHSAFGGEMFG